MRFSTVVRALVVGLVIVSAGSITLAQGRGDRGGRGGFGNFGGGFGGFGLQSALDVVNRESAQAELKLTDEQKAKVKELADQQRANAPITDFGSFRDMSEEERTAAMAEFTKKREAQKKEYDEKLKGLIAAEQFARANQLALHSYGAPALVRDEFVAEFKITDDQKTKIQAVIDESRQNFRGGFGQRPSREEMQAQNKARDEKIAALLTPEQKKAWETKLGPPPVELAATTPGTPPSTTTPPMPVVGPTPQRPVGVVEPTKKAGDMTVLQVDPAIVEKAGPADIDPDAKIISFNFRFAPWEEVLKMIAKEAGLSLEINRVPPGTFNYYDKGKYTVTEALDIINGHLLQKSHLLVKRDRFLVVLSVDDPIPANLIPEVSVEDLPKRGRFEMLSLVIQLEGIDAATAIEEVKEMLGPQGKAVPLSKTNRIVVTDIGSNLQRIHRLLTGADVVQEKTATNFKAFQLKHIAAVDAERHVRDLFGLPARGRTATAAAPTTTSSRDSRSGFDFRSAWGGGWGDRGGDRDRDRGGDRGQPQTQTPTAVAAANAAAATIQVSSDTRTNSLLVAANAEKLEIVAEVIKSIDVDQDGSGNRIGRALNTPQLEVYTLQNVDILVAVEAINGILPGLQMTQDTKGRRLSVYATPDEQAQVSGIIKQLDGGDSPSESVSVIHLKKLDALAAAASIRSLYDSRNIEKPNIEADSLGKRLMVRGSPEQVMQIKKLLAELGEDGAPVNYATAGGSNVRTFSAGGRDPQELLTMLKAMWGETRNPIRVVVPSALSPQIDRRINGPAVTPNNLEPPVSRASPAVEKTAEKTGVEKSSAKPHDSGRTGGGSGGQEPAVEDRQPDEAATEPPAGDETSTVKAPLNIAIVGDSLIVTSDDVEALNRLEQFMQTYNQMAGGRPQWSVFYLRSIDAAEAATLLGQLIPASSVSRTEDSSSIMGSFSSSLSSLGSSLVDASGLGSLGTSTALRIIPETRSNALWVTGTKDQIGQIEDILKIIDADELPETLKDRVPRRIALEHADVNEVLAIVEEVYREQLSAGQQQQGGSRGSRGGGDQQQGFNPLMMLMGGQQNNRRGVQMTIGADARTNTLIISVSDSLFKQVETMVLAIDKSAQEAERTVQVVDLKTSNSAVVQQALTSLLGKVNVSSTSQRTDSSRSGSTTPTSPFGQSPFGQSSFGQSPFGQSGQSPFGSRGTTGSTSSDDARRQFFERLRSGGGDRGSFGGFGGDRGGDRGDRGGRGR